MSSRWKGTAPDTSSDHRADTARPLKVGDRVAVYDEGLVRLAAVMAKYEPNPKPQNEGVIESIYEDGTAIIIFDAGDAAPYPLSDCTLIDGTPRHD